MRRFSPAFVLVTGLLGCAETRIYSGLPPGDPPTGYENRWHSSFFFGTTPAGRAYDLGRLCPSGWSQIELSPDFFTSFAGVVTLFLYTPSRLTIVCARPLQLARPRASEGLAP
ncbi:MAG TPA: hypothetical protein VLJ38_17975 [Polyangiaceae bacterium]|nr:hypothetical protein [Polyangiaceae bacterium]